MRTTTRTILSLIVISAFFSSCNKRKCECTDLTATNSTTTYFVDEKLSESEAQAECYNHEEWNTSCQLKD